MRIFILLILGLTLGQTAFSQSQEYVPFLDTTKRWVLGTLDEESDVNGLFDYDHTLLWFDGQKELDGKVYEVVKRTCSYQSYRKWDSLMENIIDTTGIKRCDTTDYAYIREDTILQKVFIHSSLYKPLNKCNSIFKTRLYFDSDAEQGEELLMDFSAIKPNTNHLIIPVTDRYENSVSAIRSTGGLGNLGPYYGMFINGLDEDGVFTLYGENKFLEVGHLLFEEGYDDAIFFPVASCFDNKYYTSVLKLCYSIGDNKVWASPFHAPEINEPCQLAEPTSIREFSSANNKPWIQNPVENGVLQFLQPISGKIVVQDPSGKIVLEKELRNIRTLDLELPQAGLYLLTWESDQVTLVEKVLLR
ncbi:MAG: hypothetical protein ACI9YL_001130 [Luteibaculaceae bacterium]|jgi:hypothetical protein